MARLAAYYQEYFHYAPAGYVPRQRKAACLLYEEPTNHPLENSYRRNGARLRAVASSEPILAPSVPYSPNSGIMTLNVRPDGYGVALVENSRMAIQRLQRACDSPASTSRYPADIHDYEHVYSRDGGVTCDNASHLGMRKYKSRDKLHRRSSCSGSLDSECRSPEYYVPRTGNNQQVSERSFDPYIEDSFPPSNEFIERTEDSFFCPPISYRSDSSHSKWVWTPDGYLNPALLSPPSPLDSGLSSQSITSSPSLEAEPVPMHIVPLQISRTDRHHVCSCSKRVYSDKGHHLSPSIMHDSGDSSPVVYPVPPRRRKRHDDHLNNRVTYTDNDIVDEYRRAQVRYGMSGLLGESSNSGHDARTSPRLPNENYQNFIANGHPSSAVYHYIDDNNASYKDPGPHALKSHKSLPRYVTPCVVITEAPEKHAESSLSPEQNHSDRSLEPESSVSLAVSNSTSNSSSINSSNNELSSEELRKTNKEAEKEIRELEDMYKKCSLIDYDRLERAEQRNFTAVRHTKSDQIKPRLARSKSDTLYEVPNPIYHRPYEKSPRNLSLKRMGIPDTVADDMALRKICKPVTTSSFNPADSTVTYMLCSSHFTPTVPLTKDILLADNPDIEYDDLCYRKHYFGKKSKIPDPQPPFGIPLRPPPPQTIFTDYLHAVPNSGLQPICHPRGNPDVIRDDMAFRTLRKDEPERMYYDVAQIYNKKRG